MEAMSKKKSHGQDGGMGDDDVSLINQNYEEAPKIHTSVRDGPGNKLAFRD